MRKILLVEDDLVLGEMLSQRLSEEYELKWARTLIDSKNHLEKDGPFDLLILDVGLPDGQGFDLMDFPFKVRPPVIFLTARSDAESRLKGYELGAEEFIPKPFHLKELLLRLEHVLEAHTKEGQLDLAEVYIDFTQLSVRHKSGQVEYPPMTDLKVLKFLVDAAPRPVSRDDIIDHVWGMDKNPSHRTIDNTIVRIKKLLGPQDEDRVRSVRGVGYQWVSDTERKES
ncbi:MAG: response regulator transcription factor [Bdellovibrionota bacterium]